MVSGHHLKVKGQMMLLQSKKHMIYLCSPYVTSINELLQNGMRLTGISSSKSKISINSSSNASPRRNPRLDPPQPAASY